MDPKTNCFRTMGLEPETAAAWFFVMSLMLSLATNPHQD